jgi:hypothetical protein
MTFQLPIQLESLRRGRLRLLAAWLALAVALAVFGHSTHTHKHGSVDNRPVCGFCVSLERGMGPAQAAVTVAEVPAPVSREALAPAATPALSPLDLPRARGPPSLSA